MGLWDHEQRDYERSECERAKLEATLAACGEGPFVNALELGGSIGVFTEMLAPRCRALTTVDVARTAAAMAERRLADLPQVRIIRGPIPEAVPAEEFDLIVASEILSHLAAADLDRTLGLIRARLVSGGRLVAVHWRAPAQCAAEAVHLRLREDPWLTPVRTDDRGIYLLDALERHRDRSR